MDSQLEGKVTNDHFFDSQSNRPNALIQRQRHRGVCSCKLTISLPFIFVIQFLSEETFLSKPLAVILLAFHLGTLAYFCFKWLKSARAQSQPCLFIGKPLSADYVAYTMIVSNIVGVVSARTLHYQFYSWYFHALPLFLWISPTYHVIPRVLLLGMVEYAFNVFPATPTSSALLQVAHLFLLIGIKTPQELDMTIMERTTDAETKGD